jgi:hypothetical protein
MPDKIDKDTYQDEPDSIDKFLLSPGASRDTQEINIAMRSVPLTLQPFFKEQIDLNRELVQRFPNMPLMSTVKFRDLYGDGDRGVATLMSQDGAASLIVDIGANHSNMQFSFMFGSMLSLRFHLSELSELDRSAWLDNMQTRIDDIVFLWGQSRWEKDYVICVPHTYYISMLAFSPNNFEAAVRITPSLSAELFGWMRKFWYPDDSSETKKTDNESGKDIFSSW